MRPIHSSPSDTAGSPGLPPTAPFPSVVQTAVCMWRPLEYLEWCRHWIGPRFTMKPVDKPPLVFLADPSEIRAVVTAPLAILHAGVGATVTTPLFGNTSFMLREEDERINGRDAIMPAFHRQAVVSYTDMVSDLASRAVGSWPRDTPTAIYPRVCSLTLTVMLRAVFGAGNDRTIERLRDRMLSMLSVTASLLLHQPPLRHVPGWRHIWSCFVRDRKGVDELIASIIARRQRVGETGSDMLDMLLGAARLDGLPMTAKELRDNLVSVIIAGHETTASAVAWAMQLLAHNPHVQDRLAAEIDDGQSDQYLQATVNEVLRHRPVFLFAAPRAVAQPIEIGGWTYGPPAQLLGCIYLMHHDPALFPDPHSFQPERFLDAGPSRASRVWLPWGGGRQRCPGRHLALLELRAILRTVLRGLRIVPAGPTIERARWRSVIVTPHAGGRVVLRERGASRRTLAGRNAPNRGAFDAKCSDQNVVFKTGTQ
jgi:cytochrome P450